MNDAQPAGRGRGRPVLPRIPPEQLEDQRLLEILAHADQLNPYELSLGLGPWKREGVHPSALRTALRLQRRGGGAAKAYITTLQRYLTVLGLIDG